MEKNWKYKNRKLARLDSLLHLLGISNDRLTSILNRKETFYIQNTPKSGKNGKVRITYKVLSPLKDLHIIIKKKILSNITLPDYIVGGVKGHGYTHDCKTHSHKKTVISEDISNFYPSISSDIVTDIFKYHLMFSPEVSRVLADLITVNGCLVQGSVLSTDIANLVFLEKECFINSKLKEMGCDYSRYIDDITISSKKELSNQEIKEVKELVYGMIRSKNLIPHKNDKKSKIMRNGTRKTVHNVKINNDIRPEEKRKQKLRMELFNFKSKVQSSNDIIDILKLYRRVYGLINTIKQQGDNKYEQYFSELFDSLALINMNEAKKIIRLLRKQKSIPNLRKLKMTLNPLSKVDTSLKMILDSEYKAQRTKLNLKIKPSY